MNGSKIVYLPYLMEFITLDEEICSKKKLSKEKKFAAKKN
jgi:hypothetical protein